MFNQKIRPTTLDTYPLFGFFQRGHPPKLALVKKYLRHPLSQLAPVRFPRSDTGRSYSVAQATSLQYQNFGVIFHKLLKR